MLFAMDLAESLGMTLQQLDECMTPEEYELWRTRAIIKNEKDGLCGNAAMKAIRAMF